MGEIASVLVTDKHHEPFGLILTDLSHVLMLPAKFIRATDPRHLAITGEGPVEFSCNGELFYQDADLDVATFLFILDVDLYDYFGSEEFDPLDEKFALVNPLVQRVSEWLPNSVWIW